MRLGQISRKLGVSQTEIVRYLSGKNLPIEEGSNVKLGEAHVRALYAHFAPSEVVDFGQRDEEHSGSSVDKTNQWPSDSMPEEQKADKPDEAGPVVNLPVENSSTETTSAGVVPNTSSPEQNETIRAPRIELAGLKVIGKIDLPQPKKKDPAASEDTAKELAVEGLLPEGQSSVISSGDAAAGNAAPDTGKAKERPNRRDGRRDDKRRPMGKQPRDQRSYKNPIAAQREREMEEERQRRKEKAAQEKERRTQNYQKRVKHQPPTKAVRIIEEPLEQINESTFDSKPTSWFGKFMKWLRS